MSGAKSKRQDKALADKIVQQYLRDLWTQKNLLN